MTRRRHLALLPILLSGCGQLAAELQRVPPGPPPPGLVAESADPLLATADAAAQAFADRGAGLAGRPGAAAQAVAQLEYLALSLGTEERYPQIAGSVGRELLLARDEIRQALGILSGASANSVIRVLLAVAQDLRAGNRAAAAGRMAPPLFRPGGQDALARLAELGPLPQAANATATAREAVVRVQALGSGGSTRMVETGLGFGQRTVNVEGAISSVGY